MPRVGSRSTPQKIHAWSFSTYNAYCQCPFKLKCQKLLKLPEPKSKALERGKFVHDGCEQFIKSEKGRFTDIENFYDEFVGLQENYAAGLVMTEEQWAFDKYWQPVDDWFGRNVWVRIKVDVAEELSDTELLIIDFKTGKINGDYEEQLELYALGAFKMYDGLEKVYTELWFLDHGDVIEGPEEGYTIDDVPGLQKDWASRSKKLLNDTRFDPTPNEWCGFCHFRKENGGPCKF